MRVGGTSRVIVVVVISIALAGVAATKRAPGRVGVAVERQIPPPLSVQQAFHRFSDDAGSKLLDTLFKLGYHGGYTWDEKNGPVRPNLVAHVESGTVADSARGVYEGILSLDLHHDVLEDVAPVVSLRFVNLRDSPNWVLLTTDTYPEDPSAETPLESIRQHPHELHDAILASFSDRADAFEFWKAQERKQPATP